MNEDETATVLAWLLGGWIHEKYPKPMPVVWMEGLKGLSVEDCLTAAKRLVISERYFPSLSRFREEAVYVARMNKRRQLAPPVDDTPGVSKEEAKANIEKMRDMMKNIGKRVDDEHDESS